MKKESEAQDNIDEKKFKKVSKAALKSIVKVMNASASAPEATEYNVSDKNISPAP